MQRTRMIARIRGEQQILRNWFNFAGAVALALAVVASIGCGNKEGGSGSTLATVQGEAITMDEFHKYMEVMPNAQVTVQGQTVSLPVSDTLAFQAMRDLIAQRLVSQMAKDEGVWPSEAEITKEIEFQLKLNPEFLKALNARGLDMKLIRTSIAQDLAQERLITKGITVTKEDVDEFIKNNPKQFVEPAQADITVIAVKDDAGKAQVDQALKAGTTFADVAIRYSQAPNAAQGNTKFPPSQGLQNTAIDQLPTGPEVNLKELIQKTPELQATPWVKFQGGNAKFFINKKIPERAVAMDDYQKERLRRTMAYQRGQQGSDFQKRIADAMKAKNIQVQYTPLKDPFKNVIAKAKEADAAVPSSATQATPKPEESKTGGN